MKKDVIKKYLYESLRLWVVICSFVFTYNEAWGFEIDGISYSLSGSTVRITGCDFSIKEIVLPDSVEYNGKKYPVTEMANKAFAQHSNLEKIKLPESIISIGYKCFANCTSLKKLEIPSNVESIGESCLEGCKSLEELVVPFVGIEKSPQGPSKNTLLGTLFGTRECDGCIKTIVR